MPTRSRSASLSRRSEKTGSSWCRRPPLPSPPMSDAAAWAVTAANKFREVERTTENPTTKLLAEGLTALAEAIRDLHSG